MNPQNPCKLRWRCRVLQDDVIQVILGRAMEEQFSRIRPATRYFFQHQRPDHDQARTVSIHHWAHAEISDHDTEATLHHCAVRAVKEVAKTATRLTGEIVFQKAHWLPQQPLWEDELPLFGPPGEDRLGIPGGNTVGSSGDLVDDIKDAAHRLEALDEEYAGDDRLMVFCAKPLEKLLIRASAKAAVPCRVFGLFHYKNERSWVVTRDVSPCSLHIGAPSFDLPVKGNKLLVGARFTTWIDDPRYAVRVTP